MAAPSYTTDLTTISDCENNATPLAFTNIGTGADATETDYFIQNTACISKPFNITAGGIYVNYTTGITFTSGQCFWLWTYFGAPNALLTEVSGGMQALIGSSGTAYNLWDLYGSDTYTYGGWRCVPVDPINITPDDVVSTPTSTRQYFGVYARTSVGIGKGNPLGLDIMRYGRGEARIANGSTADGYATFSGLATTNDSQTNRWGLCQLEDGSYRVQGLMIFGYSTATDFRDSNKNIIINNTKKVTSDFNRFEVRQAGSRVDWTSVNITALGTVAKGNFACVDNADVNLDSCTFTNMGTFTFASNSTALTCIWRGCDQITAAGASITNSTITNYSGASNTSALVWNVDTNPNGLLDGTTFIMGSGTTHAIEFGTTSPTVMTLTDVNFSGYNGTDGQNDSAIHIKRTTGTVTINITGGTSPSYRSDGAAVYIVAGSVTVTLTAQTATGTTVSGVSIFVKASDGTGPFPYQELVTISNSGTTATVTHTGHGLATNDKVYIEGASLSENLGVFAITVTDTNTYTYTMNSTPSGSPTGTITSTFVLLNGTTDANGQITMSRVFSSNQPFTGWGRKSTSAPYYKEGVVTGTVSNSTGASPVALMVLDE